MSGLFKAVGLKVIPGSSSAIVPKNKLFFCAFASPSVVLPTESFLNSAVASFTFFSTGIPLPPKNLSASSLLPKAFCIAFRSIPPSLDSCSLKMVASVTEHVLMLVFLFIY